MLDIVFPKIHQEGYKFIAIAIFITIVLYSQIKNYLVLFIKFNVRIKLFGCFENSYLNQSNLVVTNNEVNGCDANNIIFDFGFTTLSNSSHILLKSKTLSHCIAVVPYGGSVKTKSTDSSGNVFKTLKQSSLYKFTETSTISYPIRWYVIKISINRFFNSTH